MGKDQSFLQENRATAARRQDEVTFQQSVSISESLKHVVWCHRLVPYAFGPIHCRQRPERGKNQGEVFEICNLDIKQKVHEINGALT